MPCLHSTRERRRDDIHSILRTDDASDPRTPPSIGIRQSCFPPTSPPLTAQSLATAQPSSSPAAVMISCAQWVPRAIVEAEAGKRPTRTEDDDDEDADEIAVDENGRPIAMPDSSSSDDDDDDDDERRNDDSNGRRL